MIVADGDVGFQPQKIRRSGLWHTAGGRVLVHLGNEKELLTSDLLGSLQRSS
jgi:hypothetical protein